ncbi:Hypp9775 [Branchiostoma lanceolatum]|uniref:Hypp9775 protein n=1 Tax=Branchiostoma lanceolatum TaxID=7740 RepID=A0A8S4MQJ8_BRALA|nr:Hypp9775 [Branchiostoma lanceolatum]
MADVLYLNRAEKLVPIFDDTDENTASPATPSQDEPCQSQMEWPLMGSTWSGWACQGQPQERVPLPVAPILSPLVQLFLAYAYPRLQSTNPPQQESNRRTEKDATVQTSVISTGESTGDVSTTAPREKYRRWDGGERPQCSCNLSRFKRYRIAAGQRTEFLQDKRTRRLMFRSCVTVLAVFLVNLLFVEVEKRTGATTSTQTA